MGWPGLGLVTPTAGKAWQQRQMVRWRLLAPPFGKCVGRNTCPRSVQEKSGVLFCRLQKVHAIKKLAPADT